MTTFNTLVATYHVHGDDSMDTLFDTQAQSRTCVEEGVAVHTLTDGRVLCEFHHSWDSTIPMEAYFADIVLCCHPEWLPHDLRVKHPALTTYHGEVAVSIGGGLGEPVSINMYVH